MSINGEKETTKMNLNGFLDGLSKEKYLVYFLLAWAGVLFFWGISGIYWRTVYFSDAYDVVKIISNLTNIGAGVMLGLLSARMLNFNLIPTIKREALATYFLLLWSGGFFFDAIAEFAYYAQYGVDADIFGSLCSLAAGAVLALFAWNLLQSSKSLSDRLQQPISPTI